MLVKKIKNWIIKKLGGLTKDEVGHIIGNDTTLQVVSVLPNGNYEVKIKEQNG